jgi:hypothetical protein
MFKPFFPSQNSDHNIFLDILIGPRFEVLCTLINNFNLKSWFNMKIDSKECFTGIPKVYRVMGKNPSEALNPKS